MQTAVVAIAGLLDGDVLINSNLPWTVSLSATRAQSGLRELQLINDFEAVALAIPYLQRETLVPLNGDADPAQAFPALVLGAGTGLGAALRFADGERPVLASEIGHAALGAGNALELQVLGKLLQRWAHVDNERVLSGSGLMNLYPCLCELRGVTPVWSSTEALIGAARSGEDALAVETLQVFCAWLGSLAGDAAIAVGARSVYLAGGISAHVQDFLADGRFRERFLNKGVLTEVLRQVPVWRVEHGQLGCWAQRSGTPHGSPRTTDRCDRHRAGRTLQTGRGRWWIAGSSCRPEHWLQAWQHYRAYARARRVEPRWFRPGTSAYRPTRLRGKYWRKVAARWMRWKPVRAGPRANCAIPPSVIAATRIATAY